MKYTIENLDKAIDSVSKAIDLDLKKHNLMVQLKSVLVRNRRAINPVFWVDDEVKKLLITMKDDTETKVPLIARVRLKIMRESNVHYLSNSTIPRWEDFKFFAKKEYENDRKQLIKEGKI